MTTRTRRRSGAAALVAGTALVGLGLAAPSSAATTPPVRYASVSTAGVLGDDQSNHPVISADGKYVAFESYARNLAPGGVHAQPDVYVRDMKRGLTRRVTVDTAGEQADGKVAFVGGISKNGRYVVFTSDAGNLVPDDTNQRWDAFVRDLRYGITTRASLTADGAQIENGDAVADGVSGDGRYVVFTGTCTCVFPDGNRFHGDVYVRDLKKGTTRAASVAPDGTRGNDESGLAEISADGRYVVFASFASNLVPGDTNGTSDVFRHDLRTGATIRVSVGPGGRQTTGGLATYYPWANTSPSVSANGRYVAFFSYGDGLVDGPHAAGDVYVRDVQAGTTTLVSAGLGGSAANDAPAFPFVPTSITANGRYVGFVSPASNLVAGDTNGWPDGFVRDLRKGITRRVSTGAFGQQGNFPTNELVLDGDGDTAAFSSNATNLLPGDTNGRLDVFVARLRK
jgi:Tol biopolymer transport system component